MAIKDSIIAFYNHLIELDADNKDNWMLHQNGMCNSVSRNPDECLSIWICIKRNFVEVVVLVEARTNDLADEYSKDVCEFLNENAVNTLTRMDHTVDRTKYRSLRRSRWVTSRQWLESPIECFDWAIKEYYNYVKLFNNI